MDQVFSISESVSNLSIFTLHPTERVVVYEQGTSAMLWDLDSDKKVKLASSSLNNIESLIFCGDDNELLIIVSIDSISVHKWESLRKLNVSNFPQSKQQVKNVFSCYDKSKKFLIVLRSFKPSNYILQLWGVSKDYLHYILSQNEFDLQQEELGNVVSLNCLDSNESNCTIVGVAESNCVRLFKVSESKISLTNRIHFSKYSIISMTQSNVHSLFLILTSTYRILLLNNKGELAGELINQDTNFTSVWCGSEQLACCGCLDGCLLYYDLFTLKLAKVTSFSSNSMKDYRNKYQPIFANAFDYKTHLQQTRKINQSAKSRRPPVVRVAFSSKINFNCQEKSNTAIALMRDGNFEATEASTGEILKQTFSHTKMMTAIVWVPDPTKLRFFAASEDGRISEWRIQADSWVSNPIDLSAEFHKSIDSQGIQSPTEQLPAISIKSLVYSQYNNILLAGDTKGNIFMINSKTMQYVNKFHLQQSEIINLSLSPKQEYIGVSFTNGQSVIVQIFDKCTTLVKLNNHSSKSNITKNIQTAIGLVEDSLHSTTTVINKQEDLIDIIPSFNTFSSSSNANNTTNQLNLNRGFSKIQMKEQSFYVIFMYSPTCLRINAIAKISDTSLSSIVIANLLVEGTIIDFQIHPSKQYVLILSKIGAVYLYHLRSAELRGVIEVPNKSTKITIDSSGLYLVIAGKGEDDTYDLDDYQEDNSIFKKSYSATEKIPAQRLMVFEIGTGKFVGQSQTSFNIGCLALSPTAEYLAVGGSSGVVSIWFSSNEIADKVNEILFAINEDGDIQSFWSRFPLYLNRDEGYIEDSKSYYQIEQNNNIKSPPKDRSFRGTIELDQNNQNAWKRHLNINDMPTLPFSAILSKVESPNQALFEFRKPGNQFNM